MVDALRRLKKDGRLIWALVLFTSRGGLIEENSSKERRFKTSPLRASC